MAESTLEIRDIDSYTKFQEQWAGVDKTRQRKEPLTQTADLTAKKYQNALESLEENFEPNKDTLTQLVTSRKQLCESRLLAARVSKKPREHARALFFENQLWHCDLALVTLNGGIQDTRILKGMAGVIVGEAIMLALNNNKKVVHFMDSTGRVVKRLDKIEANGSKLIQFASGFKPETKSA